MIFVTDNKTVSQKVRMFTGHLMSDDDKEMQQATPIALLLFLQLP